MAVAPTSIKVLVIPADGTKIHVETIETVKMEVKPSTRPSLPTPEDNALLRTTMDIIHDTRNIAANLLNLFPLTTDEQLEVMVGSEASTAGATELKERIETKTAREIKRRDDIETEAAYAHMVAHFNETPSHYEPAISLLPDIRATGKWDDEEWNQRAVLPPGIDNTYHAFYTRSKGRSSPNRLVQGVWGDVFFLKISDTEDQDGRRFYQDVDDDLCSHDFEYTAARR